MDNSLIENQLNHFKVKQRQQAVVELKRAVDGGEILINNRRSLVNMHAHSFFSFNGYGYSPSGLVWRGFKDGLSAVGVVDFDVLDGLHETLDVGQLLGIRTTVGMETRVFFKEYADKVINSPGEPGVYYFMGTGFTELPGKRSKAGKILEDLRTRARARNMAMVQRINAHMPELELDYEKDVAPLTPAGNATERHLLEAYHRKSESVFGDDLDKMNQYWCDKLGVESAEVVNVIDDRPKFHELVRAKLMKAGGVGYAKPDSEAFPPLEKVIEMIRDCGALPCATWLDGTTPGELDMGRQLEFLMGKGIEAVNIIPDRNWNIDDAMTKKIKLEKLREVVEVARALELPLNVGTELNKFGQKFVDDFDTPELKPFVDDFLRGASIIYGHTLLQQRDGMGYTSSKSKKRFGDDRAARNDFFATAGEKFTSLKKA